MGAISYIPTPQAVETAWERYADLARALINHPELAINRSFMEDLALKQKAWTEVFLASGKP